MNLLIFGLPLLLGGFSANTYQAINDDVNHVEVVNQVQPKLVSYDDNSYEITLDVDEVNNYHFDNLKSYLVNNSITSQVSILYDSVTYSIDENNSNYISYYARIDTTPYFIVLGLFGANQTELYSFGYYVNGSHGDRIEFTHDIVLVIDSTIYDDIKNAIELDIQANDTTPQMQPVLTEIVSLLVGGITGIATGIGAGVSDLVSNIFLNNGALSTFGAIIAVFGGIALAIGLSRWVMNFLTSLGAKK